ncbi:MAG: CoA-binding protein [Magnetococcales bacterium]|nr:CoA-binding protein [Magnetococcales bacterium]NGZ26784.1 CoA-binding protein [Magnetococcales bacterium]
MSVTDQELIQLLQECKTIAVVGLSPKEDRPAYRVTAYMQSKGYRIIPVNPAFPEILGEKAYPSLEEIPADLKVDLVDVFRRGEDTPPIAQSAVAIKAKAIWLQSGITNEESMAIARQAGLQAIQDKCLMVEHRRLLG